MNEYIEVTGLSLKKASSVIKDVLIVSLCKMPCIFLSL